MADAILDKDMIPDPDMCDLLMRIGRDRLDVAIYSIARDNSIIHRQFPFNTAGKPLFRALEETVYDNPAILSDYRRIHIIADTPEAMMLPARCAEENCCERIFKAAHPGVRGSIHISPTSTRNAILVYTLQEELEGFINRTFTGASIDSHFGPLCRYFATKPGRGNGRRTICNFRENAFDSLILQGNNLLQANTFSFRTVMDAVYYIMAVRDSLGLDQQTDELLLTGDQRIREEIAPVLRNYIASVMPVIFPPQMFRAGRQAIKVPFDLIVTPLCE